MSIIFLLLQMASLICISIFLTMGLINLLLKRSSKKRFKMAGLSVLVLLVSFIGFGFTVDDSAVPDEENPSPISAQAPSNNYALAENISAEPSPTPVAGLSPSHTPGSTPTPTMIPTPEPTAAPTPVPTVVPTPAPTPQPTPVLTPIPTEMPTSVPTPVPTEIPTPVPTPIPTEAPASYSNPVNDNSVTMVWIDDTAKRYHKKNGCGMDNAYQVTLEEALARGKTPCGNCYR